MCARATSTECPNAGKFIANLKFNLDMEGEMMDAILKGGDANTAATDWLKAQPGRGDAVARRRDHLRRRRCGGGGQDRARKLSRPAFGMTEQRQGSHRRDGLPVAYRCDRMTRRAPRARRQRMRGATWIRFRNSWSSYKIPVGAWGKAFFDFLTDNFNCVLPRPSPTASTSCSTGWSTSCCWCRRSLLALLIAALAWLLQRSKPLAIGVVLGLLFIINQGLWKQTVETLVLVVAAAAVSMAIGVPLGIWAAHKPKVYRVMLPVLDLMQTLPTFVYLIPVLTLFGLGIAPGLIVTIIFVIPTAVRLTHLGIVSVPKSIIEAGEAFGATKRQLLWKVELPAALPTIMAGLTQCIMLSLSMVVFAALIGAGGLGTEINRALGSRNIDLGLEAGLAIVVLAIMLDRMTRIGVGGKK